MAIALFSSCRHAVFGAFLQRDSPAGILYVEPLFIGYLFKLVFKPTLKPFLKPFLKPHTKLFASRLGTRETGLLPLMRSGSIFKPVARRAATAILLSFFVVG